MTKNTRRNRLTDLDANAPHADGFSWSESQTGSALTDEDEPGAVTMLDYDGTPVVGATQTPESQVRATRPEI